MTPLEIAQLQRDAEKAERLRIAANLRNLAAEYNRISKEKGVIANPIMETIADAIERGWLSR